MENEKEPLSDTFYEAWRRAREDQYHEQFKTVPPEPIETKQELRVYLTNKEFNALMLLLDTQKKAQAKLENTARTSRRCESNVKNEIRADKHRDLSRTYESIYNSIHEQNYDKF